MAEIAKGGAAGSGSDDDASCRTATAASLLPFGMASASETALGASGSSAAAVRLCDSGGATADVQVPSSRELLPGCAVTAAADGLTVACTRVTSLCPLIATTAVNVATLIRAGRPHE